MRLEPSTQVAIRPSVHVSKPTTDADAGKPTNGKVTSPITLVGVGEHVPDVEVPSASRHRYVVSASHSHAIMPGQAVPYLPQRTEFFFVLLCTLAVVTFFLYNLRVFNCVPQAPKDTFV